MTEATTAGYVTAYPCGSLPVAANVNFVAGRDAANAAQLVLDSSGYVCLFSSTSVHLVIDVNGAWV